MADFLIYDYTDCPEDCLDGIVRVVSLKELFDEMDKARKDDTVKIAVFEIGDCLLDWS